MTRKNLGREGGKLARYGGKLLRGCCIDCAPACNMFHLAMWRSDVDKVQHHNMSKGADFDHWMSSGADVWITAAEGVWTLHDEVNGLEWTAAKTGIVPPQYPEAWTLQNPIEIPQWIDLAYIDPARADGYRPIRMYLASTHPSRDNTAGGTGGRLYYYYGWMDGANASLTIDDVHHAYHLQVNTPSGAYGFWCPPVNLAGNIDADGTHWVRDGASNIHWPTLAGFAGGPTCFFEIDHFGGCKPLACCYEAAATLTMAIVSVTNPRYDPYMDGPAGNGQGHQYEDGSAAVAVDATTGRLAALTGIVAMGSGGPQPEYARWDKEVIAFPGGAFHEGPNIENEWGFMAYPNPTSTSMIGGRSCAANGGWEVFGSVFTGGENHDSPLWAYVLTPLGRLRRAQRNYAGGTGTFTCRYHKIKYVWSGEYAAWVRSHDEPDQPTTGLVDVTAQALVGNNAPGKCAKNVLDACHNGTPNADGVCTSTTPAGGAAAAWNAWGAWGGAAAGVGAPVEAIAARSSLVPCPLCGALFDGNKCTNCGYCDGCGA